jgi:excisionase family DNA binding protein
MAGWSNTPEASRRLARPHNEVRRTKPTRRTRDAAPDEFESGRSSRRFTRRLRTTSKVDEQNAAVRLPVLLTVDEAAELLRTTRRAIYAMVERRQLPGVIRIRRRVLLRADDLLDWLDQKRASSPKE